MFKIINNNTFIDTFHDYRFQIHFLKLALLHLKMDLLLIIIMITFFKY